MDQLHLLTVLYLIMEEGRHDEISHQQGPRIYMEQEQIQVEEVEPTSAQESEQTKVQETEPEVIQASTPVGADSASEPDSDLTNPVEDQAPTELVNP